MREIRRRVGIWFFGILAFGIFASAVLWVCGSAVVVDDYGQVTSARIVYGDQVQELYRLPGSIFYGIPEGDGEIELTCNDGNVEKWGYVTGHLHTWVRVSSGAGCVNLKAIG